MPCSVQTLISLLCQQSYAGGEDCFRICKDPVALGAVVWTEFGRKVVKVDDASLILEKAMPYLLGPKISVSDSEARN